MVHLRGGRAWLDVGPFFGEEGGGDVVVVTGWGGVTWWRHRIRHARHRYTQEPQSTRVSALSEYNVGVLTFMVTLSFSQKIEQNVRKLVRSTLLSLYLRA